MATCAAGNHMAVDEHGHCHVCGRLVRLVVPDGNQIVLFLRLESLRAAIVRRDWDDVEFQYDRVLRAATKARDSQKGAA